MSIKKKAQYLGEGVNWLKGHGCFGVSFETMRVIRKLYGKGIIYLYAFH